MREKEIESYCCREIERAGGTAEKFSSPGRVAVPDRLCSLKPGKVFFIEFKAPGQGPTPAQVRDHQRRHARGFRIYLVNSKEAIGAIIDREKRL